MVNFSIKYSRESNFKHYEDVEITEFIVRYRKEDTTLPDFLDQYPHKTIAIEFADEPTEDDINRMEALSKKYKNFYVKLSQGWLDHITSCKEKKIPFGFLGYASSWDMLNGMIELAPYAIGITNELCFSLDKISSYVRGKGIKLHVVPNIAQSGWPYTHNLTSFFISPSHIKEYAKYVDVFDLVSFDKNRRNVYYEVYKEGEWFGNLRELIPGIGQDVDNRNLPIGFAVRRIRCDKRCAKGTGGCNICVRYAELADTLSKKNMILKKNI